MVGLKHTIKNIINKFPYVRGIYRENQLFKKNSCFPPGHYYSPIIDVDDINKRNNEIWGKADIDGLKGITLHSSKQKELLKSLTKYYGELPFKSTKQADIRYYFENSFYSYTDAIILYSMIRHLKPKKIIEIGSGFSSALMLDVNELFFNNKINLIFIEPYIKRLLSLIKENDKERLTVINSDVQSVSLDIFKELKKGDILFVDSTHVVKTGSDVNYILFEILPILQTGVIVHFHDVFYPFEYPKEWVVGGRNWNEVYFLRAFLMYNNMFEIRLFNDYLHRHHAEIFKGMPLCYENTGGSLWLEKLT